MREKAVLKGAIVDLINTSEVVGECCALGGAPERRIAKQRAAEVALDTAITNYVAANVLSERARFRTRLVDLKKACPVEGCVGHPNFSIGNSVYCAEHEANAPTTTAGIKPEYAVAPWEFSKISRVGYAGTISTPPLPESVRQSLELLVRTARHFALVPYSKESGGDLQNVHRATLDAITAHVAAEVASERTRCAVPEVVRRAVAYTALDLEVRALSDKPQPHFGPTAVALRAWLDALPAAS
jgi:hypothetical protein